MNANYVKEKFCIVRVTTYLRSNIYGVILLSLSLPKYTVRDFKERRYIITNRCNKNVRSKIIFLFFYNFLCIQNCVLQFMMLYI